MESCWVMILDSGSCIILSPSSLQFTPIHKQPLTFFGITMTLQHDLVIACKAVLILLLQCHAAGGNRQRFRCHHGGFAGCVSGCPQNDSDFYGVYRQAVVLNRWGIKVEGGKYTKPFWCGPSILPYGDYEMPGAKKELGSSSCCRSR